MIYPRHCISFSASSIVIANSVTTFAFDRSEDDISAFVDSVHMNVVVALTYLSFLLNLVILLLFIYFVLFYFILFYFILFYLFIYLFIYFTYIYTLSLIFLK